MEAEGSRTTRAARRLQQGELCDVMVTLTCDDGAEGCGAAGIADYESLQLADDDDDRDGTSRMLHCTYICTSRCTDIATC